MQFALRLPARAAVLVGSLAFCLAAHTQAQAQGDVKAGREKAADKCVTCHGLDGLSKVPEAPNLAGQPENYLLAQLTAFKAGQRQNEMMSIVIQDLSPADIEDLAAYYSAIEISVGKLPGQ